MIINDLLKNQYILTDKGKQLLPDIFSFIKQYINNNINSWKYKIVYNNDFINLIKNHVHENKIQMYLLNKIMINILSADNNFINQLQQKFNLESIDNLIDLLYIIQWEYKKLILALIEPTLTVYINAAKRKFINTPQITHKITTEDYNNISRKLKNYIIHNIKNIVDVLPLIKQNNYYISAWNFSNFNGSDLQYEKKYLTKYLDNQYLILIEKINLTDEELIIAKDNQSYICKKFVNSNLNILRKMRTLILAKNKPIRDDKAKQLTDLADSRGASTEINFDPYNDIERERPIIIINDKNTGKDHVIFGHIGDSHTRCISSILPLYIKKHNININKYKMAYAYLLNNIAFVDMNEENHINNGYTIHDIINILKEHNKINKVYSTPAKNSNKITRLAKKIDLYI